MELNTLTIDKIFKFEESDVKICGTLDKPYFCGKDVATILGYKDVKDCLQKNVSNKYKKTYEEIYEELGLSQNGSDLNKPSYHEGLAVYITEAGLYELIFSSKMPIAIKFKEYVFEEVLPSIRKLGQEKYLKQLQEKERFINEQEKQLKLKDDQLKEAHSDKYHLHNAVKSKLIINKFGEPRNALYIGNSPSNIEQFLVKVGKSIRPISRTNSYNTSQPPQNAFHTLKTYKVHQGIEDKTEKYLHCLLSPFLARGVNETGSISQEQFLIHYEFLDELLCDFLKTQERIIEKINNYIGILKKNDMNYFKVKELLNKPIDIILPENITPHNAIPFNPSAAENTTPTGDTSTKETTDACVKKFTSKEIDEETNGLFKKKMIKQTEFIIQMEELGHKVIKYENSESYVTLLCANNHTFQINPTNHEIHKIKCPQCYDIEKTKSTNERIKNKGFKCISFNNKIFECPKNHTFIAPTINYMTVRKGECLVCLENQKQQEDTKIENSNEDEYGDENKLTKYNKLLLPKEIKCIDAEQSQFQCKNNHIFTPISEVNLLYKNEGCPKCPSNEKALKFCKLAEKNKGEWIFQTPVPRSKYKTGWICEKGHQFSASYQIAEKKWSKLCKECNKIEPKCKNYKLQALDIIKDYKDATIECPDVITNLCTKVKFTCAHKPDGWTIEIRHVVKNKTWRCKKCTNS